MMYPRNQIKLLDKHEKGCHGCGGRGWVSVNGNARTCPVCLGKGTLVKET